MTIKQKYTFLSKMEKILPDLISHKRILEDEPLDDYRQLVFQTGRPCTMGEVIDMFENDAQLHILYDCELHNDVLDAEACCAFSHPKGEEMYMYYVCATDGGMVTAVIVRIYDTHEDFTASLAAELQERKDSGGHFKAAMPLGELYRIALLYED